MLSIIDMITWIRRKTSFPRVMHRDSLRFTVNSWGLASFEEALNPKKVLNQNVASVQHSCIRHFFENRFFTFSYIVFDGASTGIKIGVIGWKLAKMWSFVYPCQKFTLVYEPIHECSLSWTILNQDLHSCICYIHECCSRKFDLDRIFVNIKYYLTTVYVWLLNICSSLILCISQYIVGPK